jgi:hypothetical protein
MSKNSYDLFSYFIALFKENDDEISKAYLKKGIDLEEMRLRLLKMIQDETAKFKFEAGKRRQKEFEDFVKGIDEKLSEKLDYTNLRVAARGGDSSLKSNEIEDRKILEFIKSKNKKES